MGRWHAQGPGERRAGRCTNLKMEWGNDERYSYTIRMEGAHSDPRQSASEAQLLSTIHIFPQSSDRK